MTTPSVFISYRAADSSTEARLLFASLSNYFGPDAAFLDKKRLEPGMEWPEELETGVRNAKVLLVLIQDGGKWLGVGQYGARRMEDPNDWVRREIETAFSDNKIIIPVLLNGAVIPPPEFLPGALQKLPGKQAVPVTTEKLLEKDLPELFKALEKPGLRRQDDAPPADPLADYQLPGLADLDPLPHHPAPYLGLRYFDRHAARLFFGRTRELLDFFGRIENPAVRLLCLYGYSGVGKSSFLAAGVRPRLEALRRVHYERRKKTEGFGKQVEKLCAQPQKSGKPPVYILDQAEEIFTDPLPGEPDHFVRAIAGALRAEPQATFVLGFRSDFLLQMSDLLARVDAARDDLPLRPLEYPALVEAVEGVWRDDTLRGRYQIDLEPGFAGHVARDLLNTESGSTASILQNRLLKLYNEAKKRRSAADPLVHLRIDDYRELKQNAGAEEELLDFQLRRLRDENLHGDADEKTILATLHHFVVDKPTAGTRLKNELDDANTRLLDGLRHVNLLVEIPESRAIRLSHDLLAPIVRERYNRFLLDETDRLEIENVRLRLRKVRELLSNTEFMEAWMELLEASNSNTVPEEIWPLAFELTFVLLHAGEKLEGIQALLTCAQQMRWARLPIPPFPDDIFPHQHDFPELIEYLRRCEPALYIRMEQRYFPVMRPVPAGAFDMGDVSDDREYNDETPHRVELDAFELAETPLTWHQYGLFCLADKRDLPGDSGFGRADRPVVNVSWYDAVAYLNWLSVKKGLEPAMEGEGEDDDTYAVRLHASGYRLPTEAEWEYAARSGGRHTRFGNGRDIADPAEINFDASEEYKKDYSITGQYRGATTPVRHFGPNMLGLYDMSGNVWEWCWDRYDENYYTNSPEKNPAGPDTGSHRVIRGGPWGNGAGYCRVAYRGYYDPGYRDHDVGFRPARTVKF